MTPTPLRNIRVDHVLWDAAQVKAQTEDRSLSEVIRELLAQWACGDTNEVA